MLSNGAPLGEFQAHGFGQFRLPRIEGPESLCLQFKSRSHVQAVERAHSKLRAMTAGKFGAKTKRIFRYCNFEPETGGTVGLELTGHTFGFRDGHAASENMLRNRVCPFGEMKRSKQKPIAGTQQFIDRP
jgi:hypothetical protein